MSFGLEECEQLSNISEEDMYKYFDEIIYLINEQNIDSLEILECLNNIIFSYSTGHYTFPIHNVNKIEDWILKVWDITSLEMTEYITFIALNLQLTAICKKMRQYLGNELLSQEILEELEDSIKEVDERGLCTEDEQEDIYFTRSRTPKL